MMEQYDKEYARCIQCNLEPVSVMKNISLQTIQALLRRMGISYEEGLSKEAYLIAWVDEFCRENRWILRIIPRNYIEFLLEVWESEEIEMDELRWEMVQYLKTFGLLTYKKGNKSRKEENEIYIVESMRRQFYFLLKSKESRRIMSRYEKWNDIFSGMTYYYGMIPLVDLHELFCRCLKEQISYETFLSFIKCRADVWGLGDFLMDGKGVEYFKNHSVEEPELTYLYLMDHKNLPYKEISYENLKYIADGFGIDNRWAGLSLLGNYLMEELEISYYRATVLVHSMMTAIQNGKSYEKIREGFDTLDFPGKKQREQAEEYLSVLYKNIPVYEYKGHTRFEYQKLEQERERQRQRDRFIVLPGGAL